MDAGSLAIILKTYYPNGIKDQTLIASILKEVLLGIEHLHKNKQIHRDIKAGNILLDINGNIRITDFGLATKL